jgi:hypothetical protein
LEGLGLENVAIFKDFFEYFAAIWYNLQPFGIVCGHLVYFFRFGMFGPRKNLAALATTTVLKTQVFLNSKIRCCKEEERFENKCELIDPGFSPQKVCEELFDWIAGLPDGIFSYQKS